jgi:drug/metabolite transporter (DMT)-like permease
MRQPLVLVGLIIDLTSWVLSRVALAYLPLFAVQTVLAGSIAVTAVLASVVLGHRLTARDRAAVLAMCGAIIVVGAAADPVHDEGSTPRWGLALVIALPLLIVFGSTVARRVGPVLEAVVAGVAFVCSAMGAHLIEGHKGVVAVLLSPVAWSVLGHTLCGVWLHTRAMGRGGPGQVTAVMWSTEVVVSTAIGLLAFGETVRNDFEVPVALAIITVLGATLMLARTSGEVGHVRVAVEQSVAS